jgi:hypothetical protein
VATVLAAAAPKNDETPKVAETQKVSPGERCPTCKRKVPLTGKQRLEGFRERERLKKEARAEEGM